MASKLAASATFSIVAVLSMRFMKPLKAVPGPSSMNRVKPCANNARTEVSHNTDAQTCSTSFAEISDGVPCACAVTLEITGTPGETRFTYASSAPSVGCALAMSGE